MRTKSTITVVTFFIINIINVFSQNHNIGQLQFVLPGLGTTCINDTIADFKGPLGPTLGYQWGNEPSVSKAIYANQNCVIKDFLFDSLGQSEPNAAQEGAFLMISDYKFFTASLGDVSLCSSHSMTWEPNMLVGLNDTQWDIIDKRKNDTTHPIFGFLNKNGLTPLSGDNVSFLLLPHTGYLGDTVFSEPFASEYLFRSINDDMVIDTSDHAQKKFLGYNYCVSVNLKRYGEKYTGAADDADVLEIKLPYELHNTTIGEITFDALPSDTLDSIITTCNERRGLKTRMVNLTDSTTTSFMIKLNMLPADRSTVTVTARFRCWGNKEIGIFSNPMLSGPYTGIGTDIKKLGITAIYKGGCPIAVDFVRICTPYSVETFEGRHDAEIKEVIQDDIDSIAVYNTQQGTNLKVYRFNASTEGSVQNFDIERYVTKLVGNVFATTTTPIYPVLFDYYVQPPNRVLNCGFVGTSINAPYIEKGERRSIYRYRTLGWIAGSTQGTYTDILTLDQQLNSGYETYYPYNDELTIKGSHYSYIHFSPDSLALHPERIYELSWPDGEDSKTRAFQAFHQFQVWNIYNNELRTGFQYCDKPWYFQAQNLTWWINQERTILKSTFESSKINTNAAGLNYQDLGTDVKFTAMDFNSHGRPYTAEETRLLAYTAVGNGARGLIYDGVSYRHDDEFTRSAHFTQLNDHPLIGNPNVTADDRYEYLMRDDFGGDFFNLDNEKNPTDPLYFTKFDTVIFNFLNPNESKEEYAMANMGCHYNRIYGGRKSVRVELYKIHRLLMENASTIMDLRLQASYGKGIFRTYNQHPAITTDTILDTYICMDSIKTRKKWQPYTPGTLQGYVSVFDNQKETPEQTFFDVSLLKHNANDLNDTFYIFCQNRRTDPLIWRNMHDGIPLEQTVGDQFQIKFYSDSELDLWCDSGGVDPYALYSHDKYYWRNLYEKRFGFRILELPIRRLHTEYGKRLFAYVVKELSYDFPHPGDEDYNVIPYWLKYEKDNKICDMIPVGKYSLDGYEKIDVPLQPGRGKILLVRPIYQTYNFEVLTPKPQIIPTAVDTCEYLRNNVELIFKKADSTDANNCIYEIYCVNKSDTFNIYVPIIAEFTTYNSLDTTQDIASGFQNFNYRKDSSFTSAWFPDTVMQDTTFLATYRAHCSNSRVSYKIGTRMCYIEAFLDLPCSICECSDSVSVNLAPIQPGTLCRIIPHITQKDTLSNGKQCKYYGLLVTGGLYPNDEQIISGLSITPDPLNPQPIDFSTYNRWIDNTFMDIYCYPTCSYNLNFSFRNIYGDEVSNKDYSITIDNSQYPIDIDPIGILSNQCYSFLPAKKAIPSEELHYGQKIIVDPNPTSGKTNVKLNLENDLVGRLVLYTATGELIQEIHNGKLTKGTSNYEINLSDYPSGMYIITIESDGMSYIKKFVKE
jgi:hypothetical protein